jgi:hypothetical protein
MEEHLEAYVDEIFDLQHALDITIKYCLSDEGKQVQGMNMYLSDVASELCDFYGKTCCSRPKINTSAFNVRIMLI